MKAPHKTARFLALAFLGALALLPLSANPFLAIGPDRSAPAIRPPLGQGPLVGFQLELREKAAEALSAFKENPSIRVLGAFLLAAFIYGILHAAGPGHRKTVVFSLFLGRKAAAWEPLAAGFLAAGAHAGVGILLVLILGLLQGAITSLVATEELRAYLEAATFLLLIVIAAALVVTKAKAMVQGKGHRHHEGNGTSLYGVVLVSSLVPCPGATMLLLFALYAGQPLLGIIGVAAMSLGMGIIVSAAGYLAFTGRAGLFQSLKSKEKLVGTVSDVLELFSYLLVLAFAAYAILPWLIAPSAR